MNSEVTSKDLSLDATYDQVGQNYRKFLDWREKIVGGYVAIVGGLGVGYHQSDGHPGFKAVLLCAAVLVSLAFWVLNIRNSRFLVTCVRSGQKLESEQGGVFRSMGTLTHSSRLTHGLAINLLVAGVVAGSIFGLWFSRNEWWTDERICPILACFLLFALLVFVAEWLGNPDPGAKSRVRED